MHYDTLMINNRVYYLDSISKATYYSVSTEDLIGETIMAADQSEIKINQDSIIIFTKNKCMVVFRNGALDGESRAVYEYISSFKQYDLVYIHGNFWEGTKDYLINLKNGSKTTLWRFPLFSPSGKYILSYSADLEIMEMYNGIQLFKNTDGIIEPVFSKLIDNWEPYEIKWETDSTILIKRAKFDSKHEEHFFDYLRMKII
jgi:hypothetical protein